MHTEHAFRLRERIAALRAVAELPRPVCVPLEPGTLVLVVGEGPTSGMIEIASETDHYTVFAEDLLARADPIPTLLPNGASLS